MDLNAFLPHKSADPDGLSFTREKYLTAEGVAATGALGKEFYVAQVVAGDLRKLGLAVKPDPLPENTGHCLLPDINSGSRKAPKIQGWAKAMQKLATGLPVDGPFPGKRPPDLSIT
jgi:hypothetical protein